MLLGTSLHAVPWQLNKILDNPKAGDINNSERSVNRRESTGALRVFYQPSMISLDTYKIDVLVQTH